MPSVKSEKSREPSAILDKIYANPFALVFVFFKYLSKLS